jgi:hypothetical protein
VAARFLDIKARPHPSRRPLRGLLRMRSSDDWK